MPHLPLPQKCTLKFSLAVYLPIYLLALQEAQTNGCPVTELRSFLIQPIQRIYRYILLLSDLFSKLGDTHVELPSLQRSVEDYAAFGERLDEVTI
jgi:hypothetical protein